MSILQTIIIPDDVYAMRDYLMDVNSYSQVISILQSVATSGSDNMLYEILRKLRTFTDRGSTNSVLVDDVVQILMDNRRYQHVAEVLSTYMFTKRLLSLNAIGNNTISYLIDALQLLYNNNRIRDFCSAVSVILPIIDMNIENIDSQFYDDISYLEDCAVQMHCTGY